MGETERKDNDVFALPSCFAEAEKRACWVDKTPKHQALNKKYLAAKRAFDVVSSGAAIVCLSPLMLATAAAVRATSEGPAIFKQERYGKDEVPFTCYKFRSMTIDTPSDIPTSEMHENPSVMTPIGGFLRKTSIDELPQLFNIFKGDMSVIGPRPMILSEHNQIEERAKYDANCIKPGLTGWAQVNGRDDVSVEDKAKLDGEYRDHMSPLFDAFVIAKSIGVVATKAGYEKSKRPRRVPMEIDVEKPLNLLVVTQHYWPEPFNFADICEGLVERGHKVTVLTGFPNYPEGDIYPGYSGNKPFKEEHNGVKIVRAPLVPRGHNPVQRVLNYYSFPTSASNVSKTLEDDFDVIISFQSSPVMQSQAAIDIAERTGAPLLHYVIDIWPECLLAGGIKRNTPIYNHYASVSRAIYDKADKIAVTSPRFKSYLEELLGREINSFDLPQYAEDIFGKERPNDERPADYDSNKLNFTFAGNVGSAQSVKTLIIAAAILQDDDRFVFHIVGSGSELDNCKQLVQQLGINNVVFHGRHDISEMPAFYAASDAMVATFADSPVLGFTLPRKIQSYMAAGRPVIASATGEAERVISDANCGFTCEAEDPEALAIAVMKFAYLDRDARNLMGSNGALYNQIHFSKNRFFTTLIDELQQMRGTVHAE